MYSYSKTRKVRQCPPLPLVTSSLQQVCNNELQISPKETMKICQKLYESGYITYMRTDSKVFSYKFIQDVKEYTISNWGDDYVHKHIDSLLLHKKNKENDGKTQDAHEAIRPTDILIKEIPVHYHPREKKVYSLIWRISCAACMSDCILNSFTVSVTAPCDYVYKYTASKIAFPGWKILHKKELETDKNYEFCKSIKQTKIN